MNEKTKREDFEFIPVDGTHMLAVNEGIDTLHALSMADCLDSFVRTCLFEAVEKTMDAETAYACEFMMGVSAALRTASGATA